MTITANLLPITACCCVLLGLVLAPARCANLTTPSDQLKKSSSQQSTQQVQPPWRPVVQHQHSQRIYTPQAQASEPRSFQAENSFPPPIIKHRENGATVGLDLPDSNLRLLLDIDELASKSISENIKFKVVERNQDASDKHNSASMVRPTQYSPPLQQQSSKPLGSYQGPPPPPPAAKFQSGPPGSPQQAKKYQVGYIRAADLHTVLSRGVVPAGKISNSGPNYGHNRQRDNHNGNIHTQASGQHRISKQFSQPLSGDNNNAMPAPSIASQFVNQQQPQTAAQTASYSKTNIKPSQQHQGKTNYPPAPTQQQKSRASGKTSRPKDVQVSQKTYEDDSASEQRMIKPRGPTEKPSFTTMADKFSSDEQQKHIDLSDDDGEGDIELVKVDDDGFGNDDVQAQIKEQPTSTPSTNAHQSLNLKKEENKNEVESDDFDDENEDFTIIKPFPQNANQQDSCSASCQSTCMPSTRSISGDMDSMTVKEFAARIKADAIFDMFPEMEEQFQMVLDFATSGYTMFLPSNDAIARLPRSLVKSLKSNPEELKRIVENHVSDEKQTMKEVKNMLTMKPRAASARLTVHKQTDHSMTVNGQRIIQMNQRGPMGGIVHIIDGLLYPVADKNIMKTLKACNRFDGFVTLAEGTGIGDTLSGDGPFTVFVPSNEALQKIPDADLDRIRNNMTSLKEFLMYHVAQGSFYSSDLRDGQFLPSMMPSQEIQVGVRVDGCARRLVEANVSPLYRADIPASNGVLHIVDWILKPSDRDWCEGVVLPRR